MVTALLGFLFVLTLVLLPLLLLSALFRVALSVVLLPLRLLGAALNVACAGAGLLLKLAFGLGALVVGVVLAPLLPLVLLALMAWLFVKLLTPAHA
jgi:hypothetical protein